MKEIIYGTQLYLSGYENFFFSLLLYQDEINSQTSHN